MKIIGTLGGVMIASIAFLQPAHGGSRGSGRSFAPSHHSSAPARHFAAPSRNSPGGGARFHSPSAPFSSGVAFRNRSFSNSAARFAVHRTNTFNGQNLNTRGTFSNRTFSGPGPRLAANRSSFRNRTFNNTQGRIVARHSGNWHRNWDRRRDHFWRGHRCHWHNNAWVIFAPDFFYPYSYGYGYYPYNTYAYDDRSYSDDNYASTEYSQQSYQPPSEYDNGDADGNVSQVQSALSTEGYYSGAIDGRLGPSTQSALRRYQRDHGLAITGRIDRAVINALGLR